MDVDERREIIDVGGKDRRVEKTFSTRVCQLLMIHMTGGAPFGFRIASIQANGCSPFVVSMLRVNGKAYKAGLLESDLVLAINGFSCYNAISHQSATKLMEYDDPELTLHILRGENICEDDINTSLQSLDSQTLVLTDEEILSAVIRKQSTQQFRSSYSNTYQLNGPSQTNMSPFCLQPPSHVRGKLAERRKDKKITSERIEDSEKNGACSYDSTNQSRNHRYWMTVGEAKTNIPDIRLDEIKVGNGHPSNCKNKIIESTSSAENVGTNLQQELNLKVDEQKTENVSFIDRQYSGPFDKSLTYKCSETLDNLSSVDVKMENQSFAFMNQKEVKSDEIEQNNEDQSKTKNAVDHNKTPCINRYRVEQKIEFKPPQQSRYYDAESGQFIEQTATGKPQKKRSNSISSCHMYIGPITFKSSAGAVATEPFQSEGFERRNEKDMNKCFSNQNFNNKLTNQQNFVAFPSIGSARDTSYLASPESNLRSQFSLVESQLTTNNNSEIVNQIFDFERSSKPCSWCPRVEAETREINFRQPLLETNLCYKSVTSNNLPTETVERPSSLSTTRSRWCPTPEFSIPVSFTSTICSYPSTLMSHPSTPDSSTATSKLIRLRSSGKVDTNTQQLVPVSSASEPDTSMRTFCPSAHQVRELKSASSATNDSRQWRTLGTQHRTTETVCNDNEPIYKTTNTRSNPTMTPQLFSLDNIAMDEGKGAKLFARRRANSDAWIVSERNDRTTPAVTPDARTNAKIYSDTSTPMASANPRRRRSLLIGQNQRLMHMHQPLINDNMCNKWAINSFAVNQPAASALQQRSRYSEPKGSDQFGNRTTIQSPKYWHPMGTVCQNNYEIRSIGETQPAYRQQNEDFSRRHGGYSHRNPGYTDL